MVINWAVAPSCIKFLNLKYPVENPLAPTEKLNPLDNVAVPPLWPNLMTVEDPVEFTMILPLNVVPTALRAILI